MVLGIGVGYILAVIEDERRYEEVANG